MNISVIVIAKNEEKNIQGCLKSLKFADEIIVIDNRSVDRTVEIAKSYGAKVYIEAGSDFSRLRNIGKVKAKGNWLLYIDADERVTVELAREIKAKLKDSSEVSYYYVMRNNFFFGKLWPLKEKIIRMMRKDALTGWKGSLHESPVVTGWADMLKSPLMHFTHSDLTAMIVKTNNWSDIEALLRFKANHPPMVWWRFWRVMLSSFFKSYIQEGGWKMGKIGLIESIYQTFSMFITYAKLWELQNIRKIKYEE